MPGLLWAWVLSAGLAVDLVPPARHFECRERTSSRVIAAAGVTVCTARPTQMDGVTIEGVLVTAVQQDGLAEHEGLRSGDLVYEIANVAVKTAEDAAARLGGLRAEADTLVNFFRGANSYLVHLRRH